VNVLFYEFLQRQFPTIKDKVRLLPDPVAANPRLSRSQSRNALGIPVEGRYLGVVGSLDPRKAILETLAAFRSVAKTYDHVLLAGKLHPAFRQAIFERYATLIHDGRLHLVDRYLTQAEVLTAFTALDVVCVPYPGFGNLSGTLLNAVSAGRPVLVNAFGWSKAMVERYHLGWCCNILNPIEFAAAMDAALNSGGEYQETSAARELLRFHSPDNFSESMVKGVRGRMRAAV
jgi:glycosyltransferase involved in cell wall biosynthesis